MPPPDLAIVRKPTRTDPLRPRPMLLSEARRFHRIAQFPEVDCPARNESSGTAWLLCPRGLALLEGWWLIPLDKKSGNGRPRTETPTLYSRQGRGYEVSARI